MNQPPNGHGEKHSLPTVSRAYSQPLIAQGRHHRRSQTVHAYQLGQGTAHETGTQDLHEAYLTTLHQLQKAQQEKLAAIHAQLSYIHEMKDAPVIGPVVLPGPQYPIQFSSQPFPIPQSVQASIHQTHQAIPHQYMMGSTYQPTFPVLQSPTMSPGSSPPMHPTTSLQRITHPGKSSVSTLCHAVDDLNVKQDAELLLGLKSRSTSPCPTEVMEEASGGIPQEWDVRARFHSTPLPQTFRATSSGNFDHWNAGDARDGSPTSLAGQFQTFPPAQFPYYDPSHYRTMTSGSLASIDSTILNSPITVTSQVDTMRRHPSDDSSEYNFDQADQHSEEEKPKRGRESKGTIEWRDSEAGKIRVWKCNTCRKDFATSYVL
jgi:hypothetical protein